MDVDRVLLASPRGFCAGVEMAIKALAWMVRTFDPPVYCYHEIVHNKLVVDRFRDLGVVFVDDIAEVPAGPSDHAVGPRLGARGGGRRPGPRLATWSTPCARSSPRCTTRCGCGPGRATASCTSATRATRRRSARWRWRRRPCTGSSRWPTWRRCRRSTSPSPSSPRPRCRTGTGPACWPPPASGSRSCGRPGARDLCFATTNRQSALMAMAPRCDAVVVIGSANSSNTRALEKLALEAGAGRVLPGQPGRRAARRPPRHGRRDGRGVGARGAGRRGASPGCSPAHGVELVTVTDEDEYFPPPRNIRDLQSAVELAVTTMLGGRATAGRWTTGPSKPAPCWPPRASGAARRWRRMRPCRAADCRAKRVGAERRR